MTVVTRPDLRPWLLAFQCCPGTAIHHVPTEVYAILREEKFLDLEHDLTDKGLKELKK